MTEPANIYESIDKLVELETKKIDLLRELKRALRLADLVGIPAKEIKGHIQTKLREGDSTFRPWSGAVFSVRIGDMPWDDFPLIDVHKDLWPEHLVKSYDMWERSKGKMHPRRSGS